MKTLEEIREEIFKSAGVLHFRILNPKEMPGCEAMANTDTKTIYASEELNLKNLFILAHEAGHIHHQHRGMAMHRSEYEAEKFAIQAFEHFGLPIPAASLKEAKINVHLACLFDLNTNLCDEIEPEIKDFYKDSPPPSTMEVLTYIINALKSRARL